MPLGAGCDICYRIAVDIMKFKTFEDFLHFYHSESDSQTKETAESIRVVLENPAAPREWKPISAAKGIKYQCEVSKVFRGYDANTLKSGLQMTRLTAKSTHGVLALEGPSLKCIGEEEKYYLFERPRDLPADDEGVDITVKASFSYKSQQSLLEPEEATFKNHANTEFKHAAEEDDCLAGLASLAGKTPQTLQQFLAAHKEAQQAIVPTPSMSKSPNKRLQGRAAKDFQLRDEAPKNDGNIDLTDELVQSMPSGSGSTKKHIWGAAAASAIDGASADGETVGYGGGDDEESDAGDKQGMTSVFCQKQHQKSDMLAPS